MQENFTTLKLFFIFYLTKYNESITLRVIKIEDVMIVSIKTQNRKQKKELKELLRELKSKTRYTYPEIIIMALKLFRSEV